MRKAVVALVSMALIAMSPFVNQVASATSVETVAGDAGHTPGFVTFREYKNVWRGMPRKKVHRIFDAKGAVILSGGMHPYETRCYFAHANHRQIFHVDYGYRNGKVRLVGKTRLFRNHPGSGCRL